MAQRPHFSVICTFAQILGALLGLISMRPFSIKDYFNRAEKGLCRLPMPVDLETSRPQPVASRANEDVPRSWSLGPRFVAVGPVDSS